MTRAATAENLDIQRLRQVPVIFSSCTETTKVNNPKLAVWISKLLQLCNRRENSHWMAESVLTRFSPTVDFVGVKCCFALSAALLHFQRGNLSHVIALRDSVSFYCTIDTSHREPAAKSHSSSCMGLFMFTTERVYRRLKQRKVHLAGRRIEQVWLKTSDI